MSVDYGPLMDEKLLGRKNQPEMTRAGRERSWQSCAASTPQQIKLITSLIKSALASFEK